MSVKTGTSDRKLGSIASSNSQRRIADLELSRGLRMQRPSQPTRGFAVHHRGAAARVQARRAPPRRNLLRRARPVSAEERLDVRLEVVEIRAALVGAPLLRHTPRRVISPAMHLALARAARPASRTACRPRTARTRSCCRRRLPRSTSISPGHSEIAHHASSAEIGLASASVSRPGNSSRCSARVHEAVGDRFLVAAIREQQHQRARATTALLGRRLRASAALRVAARDLVVAVDPRRSLRSGPPRSRCRSDGSAE